MVEIRYAPLFRLFSILGVFTFVGMAFTGWMAYRVEGTQFGLVMMWPMLGIGLYWLIALAAAPQSVRFGADHLTVRRWLGTKTIRYEMVTSVSQSRRFITLKTRTETVRLHKLFANDDAKLINALETYVPAAKQARARRIAGTFPIVLKGKIAIPLTTALVGVVLLVFGLGTWWQVLLNPAELDPSQFVIMPLIGLISVGCGMLFLYLLLWTYPRRTIFTADRMTQHFLVHTTLQPMRGVVDFQPGYEIRLVRGVQRRVYYITFIYENGDTFRWIPNEFYFPMDYIDAAAASLATELTEQLRHAYLLAPPPTA